MAGESKIGTDWRDDELDAIVADYFAMLDSDLAGQPYSKSEHNAALMAQIGRTHGSIEYKHQNISAVLDKLGMTWIPGYKPMKNIQHSIFGAIDRYLTGHSSVLLAVPPSPSLATSAASVFVDPPAVTAAEPIPVALRRLVRKFDPVERDHRNRWLGRAGEEFVLNLERRQLAEADRSDFTRKVRWVATEDSTFFPLTYRVANGCWKLRLPTDRPAHRSSSAETSLPSRRSARRTGAFYRVHLFAREPRIFSIAPPLDKVIHLRPDTWRASF